MIKKFYLSIGSTEGGGLIQIRAAFEAFAASRVITSGPCADLFGLEDLATTSGDKKKFEPSGL